MPLRDWTDPEGNVELHHYAHANSNQDELDLDVSRFGEGPWSKNEVKAERTPKTFFYVEPEYRESFFSGRTHFHTKVPASTIYDLNADPKRIVSRIGSRGTAFNLTHVLHVLKRLGYHGVFYNDLGHGSNPLVAMLRNTKVFRCPASPTRLARMEDTSDMAGLIRHITHNDIHPSDPIHGHLADAMLDAGDPRHEIVRHSWKQARAQELPQDTYGAQHELNDREIDRMQELAGSTGRTPRVSRYFAARMWNPAQPWDDNAPVVHIHHMIGPGGKHGFLLRTNFDNAMLPGFQAPASANWDDVAHTRAFATRHSKAMSLPEFRIWLNSLDPDQRKIVIDRLVENHREYKRLPARLARSGYGYCFECKAPFIKYDKERQMVYCPNGHKRRYLGRPKKLSATRAPTGGAIVNNQYHTGGQFLPRAFKRIARVVAEHRVRQRERALKLARGDKRKVSDVLSPEDKHAMRSEEKTREFNNLLDQSISDAPESPLPTKRELKTLGSVGESVRGQYAHTGKVLARFIGEDNAKLFAAANAILSPLANWEQHSRASMRLLRLWREAGSPRNPKKIHAIVQSLSPGSGTEKDTKGSAIYGSLGWGAKSKKLEHMLANPETYIKAIEHVASSSRRGKIVDFGRAHHEATGTPIDTHMAKLTVPYHDLIQGTKVSHRLVKALSASGHPELRKALLDAQKTFINKPEVYNAYKVALAHAAEELGWEPRELQESVWAAVVSLVAAKNLNIPTSEILSRLRHEDVFHAWNVGGLLNKPEALGDVQRLTNTPGRAKNFPSAANRAPSATGEIQVGDPSALEDVASRVPPGSSSAGAWKPVQAAIKERQAPGLF